MPRMLSFVAEAERSVPHSAAACFARLADFSTWSRWMPPAFVPVDGPKQQMAPGDPLRVRIGGVPGVTPMRVIHVEPGRSVAWTGGVPGVLKAVHEFRFEATDSGTRMRSIETWSGAMAFGPVAWKVRKQAEKIGRLQLEGLARDLDANP